MYMFEMDVRDFVEVKRNSKIVVSQTADIKEGDKIIIDEFISLSSGKEKTGRKIFTFVKSIDFINDNLFKVLNLQSVQ